MTQNRDNTAYFRKYGLARDPFPKDTGERPLYFTRDLEQRLERIFGLVEGSEDVLLVVAAAGGGKTVLARYLAGAGESAWSVCSVKAEASMDPNMLALKLLQNADKDASFDPDRAVIALHKYLEQCNRNSIVPVFIIDDAHVFGAETLSFLLQLAELRYNESRFHFILFAAEAIHDRLQASELQELADKSVRTIRVAPFTEQHTAAYLQFCLETSGGEESPFTIEDIQYIHRASAGLPGGINLLARELLQSRAAAGSGRGRKLLFAGIAVLLVAAVAWPLYQRFVPPPPPAAVPVAAPERAPAPVPAAEPEPPPPAPLDMDTVLAWLAEREVAVEHRVHLTLTAGLGAPPGGSAPAVPEPAASARPVAGATEPPADAAAAVKPEAVGQAVAFRGPDWFQSQPAGNYVLQILVASQTSTLDNLLKEYPDQADRLAMYTAPNSNGELRYFVVYGSFPDRDAAAQARDQLPEGLRSLKPWPRSVAGIIDALNESR